MMTPNGIKIDQPLPGSTASTATLTLTMLVSNGAVAQMRFFALISGHTSQYPAIQHCGSGYMFLEIIRYPLSLEITALNMDGKAIRRKCRTLYVTNQALRFGFLFFAFFCFSNFCLRSSA
jgi:hypothetical protein